MDFGIYIESIMDKMKTANFYSEIEQKVLRDKLENYLKKEYNKRIEIAGFKYDLSVINNEPQSVDEIHKALADVKSEMIGVIRELSRVKL